MKSRLHWRWLPVTNIICLSLTECGQFLGMPRYHHPTAVWHPPAWPGHLFMPLLVSPSMCLLMSRIACWTASNCKSIRALTSWSVQRVRNANVDASAWLQIGWHALEGPPVPLVSAHSNERRVRARAFEHLTVTRLVNYCCCCKFRVTWVCPITHPHDQHWKNTGDFHNNWPFCCSLVERCNSSAHSNRSLQWKLQHFVVSTADASAWAVNRKVPRVRIGGQVSR